MEEDSQQRFYWVPKALTWLRVTLGPIIVMLALLYPHAGMFAACLIAAFLSDVFDGIVARRLGIATAALRRLDSIADSIFYICALWAAWHLQPEVIAGNLLLLVVLLILELLRYTFDLWKFGKEASYHMWSSKLWGIALFAGFLSVLVFGDNGIFVRAAIIIGILADTEGLLISAVLNSWHHDVPSIVHAFKLRAVIVADK